MKYKRNYLTESVFFFFTGEIMSTYHPGHGVTETAFRETGNSGGYYDETAEKWSCCGCRLSAPGCTPTPAPLTPFEQQMNVVRSMPDPCVIQ